MNLQPQLTLTRLTAWKLGFLQRSPDAVNTIAHTETSACDSVVS